MIKTMVMMLKCSEAFGNKLTSTITYCGCIDPLCACMVLKCTIKTSSTQTIIIV